MKTAHRPTGGSVMNIQPNIPLAEYQKLDPIGMLEHEVFDRVLELCKAEGLEKTREIIAEAFWFYTDRRKRHNG